MKKTKILALMALASVIFTISCSDDDNNLSEADITEEVANDIAASLGTSNYGLTGEIIEVTEVSGENEPETQKSVLIDTIYSYSTSNTITNPSGTLITYSYFYQTEYGYVLEDYLLDNFYYNSSLSGSFDAPRISSSESRTCNWVMTGWEVSSTEYIFNGEVEREGYSQSKIRNKSVINSSSQISLVNLKVNKSTFVITEGILNYQISGTANEQDFNYSATVTYTNNGKAELHINGKNYTIDITAGEIED